MSRLRTCIIGPLSALLVACASYGPLGTAQFEPTLRRDVPAIEGKILLQSPATLLYGIDGYKFSDLLLAHSNFPGDKYIEGEGIAVLTEQKLFFVKWSGQKYENKWDLDYRKVQSIEIRKLGLGRSLVVQLSGTPAVVSYQIPSDDRPTIERQKTMTVICQLVAQRAGKNCQLPE